ncbi:hypothetical protein Pmar_PMAR029186 [Perkinsus marinus ATCC 50983]|uniref:Uncharacterized protein n=1 Tax=Perkinsus marinus (strain ATCC 50983 / TXsc) TaxID=423536 RepID=C5M0V5_PERM5|nr:hypothetical protein Pmar_PMAR029186 [Perkinsus marinus ATCC 50983]EEQ97463.1 hypothetical protein Pmar_PMAR029186 [Perkinsus marinus ATCC 50983]|eukprot:XP_002764746.1 hypothetical protein Pmar_PMAR029186 [Perkinsus marinus ATCC 50983]
MSAEVTSVKHRGLVWLEKVTLNEDLGYACDAIFATVSKLENQLTVTGFCGGL